MNEDEKIGRLVREYSEALRKALECSKELAALSIERPWVQRTDPEAEYERARLLNNSIVDFWKYGMADKKEVEEKVKLRIPLIPGTKMRLEVR
jgi:hypothetical protein